MKPCDICLDEKCQGKRNCQCDSCQFKNVCPKRSLRPTIRITQKCTQTCKHCCFSCSPKRTDMMSVEMSKNIGKFLKLNKVKSINLMGGEFICHPSWFNIFENILGDSCRARIVSNSDWANSPHTTKKVIEFSEIFSDRIYFALSDDEWHDSRYLKVAIKILKYSNIPFQLGNGENDNKENIMNNSIVPIGNATDIFSFYSMFGAYCHHEENKYSFLIDEIGDIFKCSFGVWKYDNIRDFVNGGFNERFKDFNSRFYSIFIPNCKSCIRQSNLNII